MIKKVIANFVAKKMRNRLQKQTLNDADVNEILQEIKIVLVDADVNVNVINSFSDQIRKKLSGKIIDPDVDVQKFLINEIRKELVSVLDNGDTSVNLNANPTIIMLVGLQGTGKTTTVGKLANYFKTKKKKNPLTVGLDVYRPAAIDQLRILSDAVKVDFFEKGYQDPLLTASESIIFAKNNGNDVVLLDTAGRLQTDQKMMQELVDITKKVKPDEVLLVVDATTGQEVVEIAKEFDEKLHLTGVIVTKLDSDSSAGAIFSIASVVKKPIKFTGTGEKSDQLGNFYPERIASRILGLGDILTLAEKSMEVVNEKTVMKSLQKMLSGKMDLEDLLIQIVSMNKVGSLNSIVKMLPSIPGLNIDQVEETEERITV